MTEETNINGNFDLKDILRERPPVYLIPKFNILPLMSLPHSDLLQLENNDDEDLFDFAKDFLEEEKNDRISSWKELNENTELSQCDQQQILKLLKEVDDSKIRFQNLSTVFNNVDLNETKDEYNNNVDNLSNVSKTIFKQAVKFSTLEEQYIQSKSTQQKRKYTISDDTKSADEDLNGKRIKIKIEKTSLALSSQLKFACIDFDNFSQNSTESINFLISQFNNIVAVLSINDFSNREVWFPYSESFQEGGEKMSEQIYGIQYDFIKTIKFFSSKMHSLFKDLNMPLTSEIWTLSAKLLDFLSVNLSFDDEIVNKGRNLKLETIKVIIDLYSFSLYKVESDKGSSRLFNIAKPFKFESMYACLSVIAEYSQDIFDKDAGNNGDESFGNFFAFFTVEELGAFYDCLTLLYIFLQQKPILDSWNINKIILSIQHIISLGNNVNKYVLNSNDKVLRTINSIRKTATEIFKELFKRYPVQRDLILDLVVSSFDRIPNTKQGKKLIEVKSIKDVFIFPQNAITTNVREEENEEVIFISYFTYNLVSLLQMLFFEFEFMDQMEDKKQLKEILQKSFDLHKECLSWSVLVTDLVFQKLIDSFFINKNSLEVYYKDLVKLFKVPEWNIAEYLLSAITNKMIDFLSSDKLKDHENDLKDKDVEQFELKNNTYTNIEAFVLQVLAFMGSMMIEITSSTSLKTNRYTVLNLSTDIDAFFSLISYLDKLKISVMFKNRFDLANYYILKTLYLLEEIKKNILNDLVKKENQAEFLIQIDNEILKAANQINKPNVLKEEYLELLKNENNLESMQFTESLQNSTLLKFYEPYLGAVLSSLNSDKAKIRTGALSNFSALIAKNQNIIEMPFVKNTIHEMLKDSSAMVKDSILTILEQSPSLKSYIKNINLNFNESNLTVRKHVLLLNQKLYEENFSDLNTSCQSLHFIMQRLEDEDSKLEQFVANYLYEKLFVILYDSANDLTKQEVHCEKIVESLTEVINGSEKIYHLFQDFFNLISIRQHSKYDLTKKNNAIDLSKVYFSLGVITKRLIVKIVDSQQDEKYDQFSNYLSLLGIIASCESQNFINKEDLIILYPFLNMNAENKNEKIVRLSIIKIFDFCLKKEKLGFRAKILGEIELFLVSNLTKFSINELDNVVSILFNISRNMKNYENLVLTSKSLLTTFQPYLNKLQEKNAANESLQINGSIKVQKLLVLISSFAMHSTSKPELFKFCANNSSFFTHVSKILIIILTTQRKSEELLKTAMYQLGLMCNYNPALYNSPIIIETIIRILSDVYTVTDMVKVQTVKIMTKYLREQEVNPTQITEEITLGLVSKITPLVLPLIVSNKKSIIENKFIILKQMIEYIKMLQFVKFLDPQVYLGYCIPLLGSSFSEIKMSMAKFFINLDYDLTANNSNSVSIILEKGLKLSLNSFLDDKVENFININLNMFNIATILIDKKIFDVGKVVKTFMKLIKEDSVLYSRNLQSDFKSSCFLCMNILMSLNYLDKALIQDFIKLGQLNLEKYEESLIRFKSENSDVNVLYNGVISVNVYKLFVESLEKKLDDYDNVSFTISNFKWDSISFQHSINDIDFVIKQFFKN
ncbi:hypothetical protein QEN19_001822 [Hanseniaspora menglaensis]